MYAQEFLEVTKKEDLMLNSAEATACIWMVPPRSFYKLNVALKSIKDTNAVGSGCVIRGCGGYLVAASSVPIPKVCDSLWMLA